jgi:chromosome segregation ATPase
MTLPEAITTLQKLIERQKYNVNNATVQILETLVAVQQEAVKLEDKIKGLDVEYDTKQREIDERLFGLTQNLVERQADHDNTIKRLAAEEEDYKSRISQLKAEYRQQTEVVKDVDQQIELLQAEVKTAEERLQDVRDRHAKFVSEAKRAIGLE